MVGRNVGRARDRDVIFVRDGEFVFAVHPDGRLEQVACLVVLPDGQARALHRHVERVGVNGEDLVVILVSGAGDQAAVSAARQHGRLVNGVVAGRERRDGIRADVIEVVHAGRPVPDEVDAVGRLLGAGDDEVVLVERAVLVVIDAVQREEPVLAPATEYGIRLVARHDLLVGRDQGLDQIDGDLRVRVVGGHHDGVALRARLHECDVEVRGIVDVEPGERHPVPGERAQVVGVLDLAGFVVVRVVGEGEGAVRIHDVVGAVVRHPGQRVHEVAPGALADGGGVVVQLAVAAVGKVRHQGIGEDRVEHGQARSVDIGRDLGAVDHDVHDRVVEGVRRVHQG